MFKRLFIILIVLGMSGCSIGVKVDKDYHYSKDDESGIAVFSTALIDKCGSIRSYYHNIYSANSSGNFVVPVKTKADEVSDKFVKRIHAIKFKQGQYHIGRVNLNVGGRNMVSNNFNMFEFDIKPNEIVYIGELGFAVPSSCDRYFSKPINDWKNDEKLLKQKLPNIPADKVVVRLMKKSK